MVDSGGAEVPNNRFFVANQQGEPAELVSLPLADLGCCNVTNIVHVEQQQGAAFRLLEGGSRALQSVATEAIEVDAALKVDVHVTGGGNRPVPLPVRLRIIRSEKLGRKGAVQNHLQDNWPSPNDLRTRLI
jgi:hypothetical protein